MAGEGLRHEVFDETNKEEVLDAVSAFVVAQSEPARADTLRKW